MVNLGESSWRVGTGANEIARKGLNFQMVVVPKIAGRLTDQNFETKYRVSNDIMLTNSEVIRSWWKKRRWS